MFSWGWCILFLIVVLIGLVGLYLCCYLDEFLIFEEMEKV